MTMILLPLKSPTLGQPSRYLQDGFGGDKKFTSQHIAGKEKKNWKNLKSDLQLKVKISHRSQGFGWKLRLERL